MTRIRGQSVKTAVQWIVACILIGILIARVNWHDVWHAFVSVRVEFLVAFVVLYLVGIIISARKWQDLAVIAHFHRHYTFYFSTYFVGIFINHFLPSFIGGDTYRIYALGRKERRMADATATIVWDRVSGLAVFAVLALVGLLAYDGVALQQPLMRLLVAGTYAGVLVLVFGMVVVRFVHTARWKAYVPRRLAALLRSFHRLYTRRTVLVSCGWSMVFSLIAVGCANLMLFYAFDVNVTLREYISVIFLTNILAALPISVGNVGVKEWAYIVLFGMFGVDSSVLVAIVMLARVLQMVVSLAAVPLYVRRRDDMAQQRV